MKELKQIYIGEITTITESKNKSLIGLTGKIIDETKNTFKIQTIKGIKTILKYSSTFKIKGTEIKGEQINKKPQDRIKIRK